MATPTVPLRKFGAISVTKIAIPIATGIAKTRDNIVVNAVPKMLVAAPKDSFTGFQSVEVRNSRIPNFSIERDDSENNTMKIPATKTRTETEAIAVKLKNIISTGFFLGSIGKYLFLKKCHVL